MKKQRNTIHAGNIRYIVFKEEAVWYAVALELNIVESGDDSRVVLLNLFEAIEGYRESCAKLKSGRHFFNQKIEKEYEDLWKTLNTDKPVPSPYLIDTFGKKELVR